MNRDDLVVETARLFGSDRTGPDLKEAINKQTAMLVKMGRLQLDGDILRLEARGVRQNTESPPIPRDVSALIVPGRHELPRIAGVNYVGFVDPSGGSADSMTLAIAHVESDAAGAKRAVVDLIREVRPPFNPDAVVAEFASLLKAYGIRTVKGDRYGGIWPRDRFCVHGVDYQVVGKSASDFYCELLPILNSGRASSSTMLGLSRSFVSWNVTRAAACSRGTQNRGRASPN
jgi:hypothetical protein